MSALEAEAKRALDAFLSVSTGEHSYQRAEAALTLHMLEFLAPRFFAEHGLRARCDAALEALKEVPSGFGTKVDSDEAMARIDALYLRQVRGLKPRKFDRKAVKVWLKRADQHPLSAWLMGELVEPLGVEARLGFPSRWPFRSQGRVVHLYHLTHLVLLQTAYLMRPVPRSLLEELVALQEALEGLERSGSWDLLGECVFCLNRAGIRTPQAVQALLNAQLSDGSFAEAGSSARQAHHCTAVGVLALAGALDLERSAP